MTRASIVEDSAKTLLVHCLIFWLQWVFWILELLLWLPYQVLPVLVHTLKRKHSSCQKPTIVIVGANFSGLAALRELVDEAHLFQIILIDQRDYFEYTPGILRLFCQPDHFHTIAKPLPTGNSAPTHTFIQGKVVHIFGDEGSTRPQKLLTYQPIKRDRQGATFLSSSKKTLPYDYLILATGATYPAPIWPLKNEWSFQERYHGWTKVQKELCHSNRIIVLGAGAVGVELAAEIVYHYGSSKEITVVDGETSILPLFPQSVGKYAHRWLEKRGIKLLLGRKLVSWTENNCLFQDGSVLQGDIVYNCFGSRPNTDFVATTNAQNEMTLGRTKSGNIIVKNTLQIVGGPIKDGSIFACGDVAAPPTSNQKQAFHAEIQGMLAAQNIISLASIETPKLKKYPQDVMMNGSDQLPLVIDLSLGRSDGVIAFNDFCIPGPLSAVVKWIIEYTKVLQMQVRPLGTLIWKIGDFVVLFLSATFINPRHNKSD